MSKAKHREHRDPEVVQITSAPAGWWAIFGPSPPDGTASADRVAAWARVRCCDGVVRPSGLVASFGSLLIPEEISEFEGYVYDAISEPAVDALREERSTALIPAEFLP